MPARLLERNQVSPEAFRLYVPIHYTKHKPGEPQDFCNKPDAEPQGGAHDEPYHAGHQVDQPFSPRPDPVMGSIRRIDPYKTKQCPEIQ